MASIYKRFWSLDDKGEKARAGWLAAYADPTGSDVAPQKPYAYVAPLVGWALIQREGGEEIVGIIATNKVEEADKRTDGSVFVTYLQRGSWTDEQLDVLWKNLSDIGRKKQREIHEQRQREIESHRRDVESASQRRLLSAGAEQVSETVIRELQDESTFGEKGRSSDPELPDTGEVAEGG